MQSDKRGKEILMKTKKYKISPIKMAVLAAVTVSAIGGPFALSAESGVVSKKDYLPRGEDMCIAILDRGFSFEHESLVLTDKTPKLSKQAADTAFKNTEAYKALTAGVEERPKPMFKKQKQPSVYVNEKIPFAYDYGDKDTDLSGDFASHGMAMMSIAAGTDTLYSGTSAVHSGAAPEAQIFAMKVYSDEIGDVTAEAVSAAINDAVVMGADIIYIAVNEMCGFEEKEQDGYEDALANAWENGVVVVSAAGNVIEYGKGNIYSKYELINYITTDSPDVGTVAYPSSSPKVISVGSIDRYEMISDFLTLPNGESVPYSDSNFLYEIGGTKKSFAEHLDGKDIEYVICEGVGKSEELRKAGDLKGKAAVISRGEIAFAEKVKNAAACGAAAVIISDDDALQYGALEIMMALEGVTIPAVLIESDDLEKMVNSEVKTFRTNIGKSYKTKINKTPFISAFSPYGTTPELGLKPDVLAVGTAVKCAVPSGGYGYMNSTTAAGAKVAGVCAGIKEHLVTSGEKYTAQGIADRVRTLLVNSATLADDLAAGALYSPRKQGGGFVSLEKAVSADVILTADGDFKAELGDGKSAVIEFDVTAENFSDSAKECRIDCIVGMDSYTTSTYEEIGVDSAGEGIWECLGKSPKDEVSFITGYKPSEKVTAYIDGELYRINSESADYQPYSFVLAGGESRTFRVKLELDEDIYKTYGEVFENGFFVEGFLRLFCEDDVASIPFLGFCGDFNEAESLDSEIYSGIDPIYESCYLYYPSSDGGSNVCILGEIEDDGEIVYDKSALAFSPSINPKSGIYLRLGLKRSIKELTVTVTNENGEVISEQSHENVMRNYIDATTGAYRISDYYIWNGRADDNHGYLFEDGVYNITVTYRRVTTDAEKSLSYSIYFDSTAPKIENPQFESRDGETFMRLDVRDNHRLAALKIFDSRFKDPEKISDGLYNISGLAGEYIYIEAVDAAGNKTTVRIDNPCHS